MSENVEWHRSRLTREDRQLLNGHSSCILWLTGLSGSGKSTLAAALEQELFTERLRCYILDGDNLRFGINRDLGFRPEDRSENIRRIGEIARLFADAGIITIVAVIAPYREDRDKLRSSLASSGFVEIYVKCTLEECERRDPKGLYKKARSGEITHFTGISAPYEPPLHPELIVETDGETIDESVSRVMAYIRRRGLLHPSRAGGEEHGR
ncbi:adenylyl-sulfate kinase [Paenibacillus glycanilyticus]|uniref:Adenylyl-sulfate kinase n=1 Tax=Paenibacillus glycanilyticus TaxID=126569 RepID=A0ABQ6GGF3_9BACL|nr:adenylyl-sulfate kinase [Paenibacillus glycanilyticus]GLX69570.1 adenylyl-sulfate kinase [Paenibacillus glycanilyticus]